MKLRAPASSANLGPGYDVLSVALSEPYDVIDVDVEEGEGRGVSISVRGRYSHMVPTDPSRNSAGLVASRILDKFNVEAHVAIEIDKGIPVSSGLGSSAAPWMASSAWGWTGRGSWRRLVTARGHRPAWNITIT